MNETVTTYYLEMTSAEQLRPASCNDPSFRIEEAKVKQWRFNRFLYEFVGRQWKWFDKLSWTDEQWRVYVEQEGLRTFAASYGGSLAGYFELREEHQEVEIAYFGLAPEFIGKGLGGPLLTSALLAAWEGDPARVWVHTCTLDHEAALANYQSRGMVVYKTEKSDEEPPDELARSEDE